MLQLLFNTNAYPSGGVHCLCLSISTECEHNSKFPKEQPVWQQPQLIFQTLKDLPGMASLSSSLRQHCFCLDPHSLQWDWGCSLSASLNWQAGAGPGISSCWPPATAGGMAVNPQAFLAPWCQLVCAWAVFEAYGQVTEEITFSPTLSPGLPQVCSCFPGLHHTE